MSNTNTNVQKPKIALCLSGGGYRAALFHLGALCRLNELGILAKVDTVTSVSGGSLLAAHLADFLKNKQPAEQYYPEWEIQVAEPFRQFCKKDIRTVPIFKRFLLPWNWFARSTQVTALMKRYEKYLSHSKLVELPDRPNFIFCATDIVFGVNWIFERERIGNYKMNYWKTPPSWLVARAVAASSCFPPLFDPMPIGKKIINEMEEESTTTHNRELLPKIRLSDGGVYDNLGLEPVVKNHDILMVSDGGAPFEVFTAKSSLRLWMRYFGITANQVGALRKRWFMADLNTMVVKDGSTEPLKKGTYWGIGSASTNYQDTSLPGYDEALVDEIISNIRTDLDGFTEGEIAVLENHGYLLANRVITKYIPELIDNHDKEPQAPHSEWLDPGRIRKELADSHKRFSLKRILGKFKR